MDNYEIGLIGGSGFLASSLIDSFNKQNRNFVVFGRSCPPHLNPKFFRELDLAKTDLASALRLTGALQVQTLIYNAAQKGRFQKESTEWQLQGRVSSQNFSACSDNMFQRLITIGSSEEYGPRQSRQEILENETLTPISSYGYWKSELYKNGLKWQQKTGRPYIHLRPFNIFGIGADKNMFIRSMIETLSANREFAMTLGAQFRSFVPIQTVIATIESLLTHPDWNQVSRDHALNVSSPHYFEIKEVAHMIHRATGRGTLSVGALPYRTDEIWHQNPNLDNMQKLLGTKSTSVFEDDLAAMISFYSENRIGG